MLVRRLDLPFRTAHTIVGRAVQKGTIDLATLDEAATGIVGFSLSAKGLTGPDISGALDVDKSLADKRAAGSPAPISVAAAIEERKELLKGDRERLEARKEVLSGAIQSLIRDARRIAE
jgi:argininosuccinate lyase